MSSETTKAAARSLARQRRAGLNDDQLTLRAERLGTVLSRHIAPAAVVAGYLPMRGEPDLLAFLQQHSTGPGVVYLPVIPSAGRQLQFAAWTPATPLRQHRSMPLSEPDPEFTDPGGLLRLFAQAATGSRHPGEGLPEPPPPAPAPLVLLVPALAVDTSGARLGQGGGYYDTTMQQLADCSAQFPQVRYEVIAVVHSEELMEPGSFPVLDHDLRAQRAVTECGVVEF